MGVTCCVVNCGSRANRDNVQFYRIPSELKFKHKLHLNALSQQRRQKWLQAIRREDFTESKAKNTRVCSKHFVSGKPADLEEESSIDWIPTLLLGYGNQENVKLKNRITTQRAGRAKKRLKPFDEPAPEIEVTKERKIEDPIDIVNHNDKMCQTNVTAEDFTQMVVSLESTKKVEAKLNKVQIGYNFLKDNDVKTKYFTGLNSFKKVELIFEQIKDFLPAHFNIALPSFDQFLLTLIKLRLNFDFKALAYLFGISPSTASSYFRTIINVMYDRFSGLIIWPERDILVKTMPTCFREMFGTKVAVIIDCFELYIEKPSNLLKSAQCWSNYKHHHTLKYLIGITPQGTISFISEAWGRRASDKHVTINSKFLSNITPGDVILADRGFLIEDHVKLFNAHLEMPAFTKGKKQLHPVEIEKTRSIANVRIHDERIIGCIRQKYRILSDNMPISLLACGDDDPIVDKIVTICCVLINLVPPIVPLY